MAALGHGAVLVDQPGTEKQYEIAGAVIAGGVGGAMASVDDPRFVVIDSLNAFLQAMPGEKFLLLQMHEMLSYLNQQGVITMLVLGQHGIVGDVRSEIDLSYLSDTIVLFRYFEWRGRMLKAVSVAKSRTTNHETSIREFLLTEKGVQIGSPLADFEGVLTGLPNYRGETPMMAAEAAAAED